MTPSSIPAAIRSRTCNIPCCGGLANHQRRTSLAKEDAQMPAERKSPGNHIRDVRNVGILGQIRRLLSPKVYESIPCGGAARSSAYKADGGPKPSAPDGPQGFFRRPTSSASLSADHHEGTMRERIRGAGHIWKKFLGFVGCGRYVGQRTQPASHHIHSNGYEVRIG